MITKVNRAYQLLDSKLRKFLNKESNKWNARKNWRLPSVCYTLEHKLAFLACEYHFTGGYSLRGFLHDWDKPWMYMCPWLKEDEIQIIHQRNNPYHIESGKFTSIVHLVDIYIDWECAAITKPDKPLNAFETALHFYPEHLKYVIPLCLVFNSDSIKSNVWLHHWHQLAKNDEKNEEIFAQTVDILKQMSKISYSHEWARELEKEYAQVRKITQFTSAEIFMLILLWHSKKTKFEIDYAKVNNVVENVYSDMNKYTHFTHSGISGAITDFSGVKASIYCK